MSHPAEAISHLPGIGIAPGTERPLPDGSSIVSLSTADWLALEDPAMEFHVRRFEKHPHAFYRMPIADAGEPPKLSAEAMRGVVEVLNRVSLVTLLTWYSVLPHARVSIGYVRWKDAKAVVEMYGVAEREWLLGVIDHDTLPLEGASAERFDRLYAHALAVRAGRETPQLTRLAEILRAAAVPGTELADLVCNFTAVHEDLVNPTADRPLGKTFAARLARFHCDRPEAVPGFERFFTQLYDCRSQVLHGAGGSEALAHLGDNISDHDAARWLRLLTFLGLERLLTWGTRSGRAGAALGEIADDLRAAAAGSEAEWAPLRAKLAIA
jgi:hypothetical protein